MNKYQTFFLKTTLSKIFTVYTFLFCVLLTTISMAEAAEPQISAGFYHTVGLKSDGTVLAAGSNVYDQTEVSPWTDINYISAGWRHTVGVRADGTVLAVGDNTYGQLNTYWMNILQVDTGNNHTVGLRSDGTVVAVGDNEDGQLEVSSWNDIIQVIAGSWHTLGLRSDGTVVGVGDNSYGQINVSSWSDITQVDAYGRQTVGLVSDGTVVATGSNSFGQLEVSSWTNITQVSTGYRHTVGLRSDGTVVAVGYNEQGQLEVSSWTDIIQVAAGGYHTVGLKSDGTVVAVGANFYGQSRLPYWPEISQVAAGAWHTVGLKSDGTTLAVGWNHYDQLEVTSWPWEYIIQVSGGIEHTVGLRLDGKVVGVGSDLSGQLEFGSWIDIEQVDAGDWNTLGLKPDGTVLLAGSDYGGDISSWTNIVQMDSGANHMVGLKSDGTVVATGSNTYHQLEVSSWEDIIYASAGGQGSVDGYTVGVKSDGTVVAIGNNRFGQLDNLSSWTDITQVSTGAYHTVGLRSDGTVVAVGQNEYGQCDVSSWTNIIQIAAGRWHTVGLKSDGTLMAAGDNSRLQLSFYDWKLIVGEVPPDNQAPIANAGVDQSIHMGSLVMLDGSGSSDPDGDYPLTYSWQITLKPAGSTATLSDPSVSTPTFTADLEGQYIIELTVTDSLGAQSLPDQVLVSTYNTPPVAEAGPDQAADVIGETIYLGTEIQSYDPDGDPITYFWSITAKPEESQAAIDNPSSPTPSFVVDAQGDYQVTLEVSDGWTTSTDYMQVQFSNVKPVADAGDNQSVVVMDTVYLDGSGSYDANLDPLSYQWSFVSRPEGSSAEFSDPLAVTPYFTADQPGTYIVSLVVNDGIVDSDPSNISITVSSSSDDVILILQELVRVINEDLDQSTLKSSSLKNVLTRKINEVIAMIDQGLYAEALDLFSQHILTKVDGCDKNNIPENNDWIMACDQQELVYPLVVEAIQMIEDMI